MRPYLGQDRRSWRPWCWPALLFSARIGLAVRPQAAQPQEVAPLAERFEEKFAHLHVEPASHRMPLRPEDSTVLTVHFALRSMAQTIQLSLPPGYELQHKGSSESYGCKVLADEPVSERDVPSPFWMAAEALPLHNYIESCAPTTARKVKVKGVKRRRVTADSTGGVPDAEEEEDASAAGGDAGKKAEDVAEGRDFVEFKLRGGVTGLSSHEMIVEHDDKTPRLQFWSFRLHVRGPERTPQDDENFFELRWAPPRGTLEDADNWEGSVQFESWVVLGNWGCKYSEWEGWGDCSAHCGGGVQFFTRRVLLEPPPDTGRGQCKETLHKEVPCNEHLCTFPCRSEEVDVEGSVCSAKCGGGRKAIRRRWVGDNCPEACDLDAVEWVACNTQPCRAECTLDEAVTVLNECETLCGDGIFKVFHKVLVKDLDDDSCVPTWSQQPCKRKSCAEHTTSHIAFTVLIPPGIPPYANDLYKASFSFTTSVALRLVTLTAPQGYSFPNNDGQPASPGDACRLKSHNMAFRKGEVKCKIGQDVMTAHLLFPGLTGDALLPPAESETITDQMGSYNFQIMVQNPPCGAWEEELSSELGFKCVVDKDVNQWQLKLTPLEAFEPVVLASAQSYELYPMEAQERLPLQKRRTMLEYTTEFVTSESYLQGTYCSERLTCPTGQICNYDRGICSLETANSKNFDQDKKPMTSKKAARRASDEDDLESGATTSGRHAAAGALGAVLGLGALAGSGVH